MTKAEPEKLWTVQEAADQLRMHRRSLYRLIDEEKVKTIRIGETYRIRDDEMRRLMQEGTG